MGVTVSCYTKLTKRGCTMSDYNYTAELRRNKAGIKRNSS